MSFLESEMLSRAICIAAQAHNGQYDKAGEPYILHPLRVMLAGQTYEERIVGVLHDVLEDTDVTLQALQEAGFSPEILEAVDTLTHRKHESYNDYITRIIESKGIAVRVKLADLTDNSDLSRIQYPTQRDLLRWEKYNLSYQRLIRSLA